MFGVVMNHVFNNGLHIYDDFTVDTSTWMGFLVWSLLEFMKLIALPSVNCYIIITGYFGSPVNSCVYPYIIDSL